MSLFRREALLNKNKHLEGSVSLAQPLSIKLTVLLLLSITFIILAFLFTAEYSRKETVRGFLTPNKGVIKSFAAQGGTIERIMVKEGDKVEKGQALVDVVIHQNNEDGLSLSGELEAQLSSQMILLEEEINQHKSIEQQENKNLEVKAEALESEKVALQNQGLLIDEKLQLLIAQSSKAEELSKHGFVSEFEKEEQQKAILEAKQEKQNLNRALLQHSNQIEQLLFEQQNLPQKYTLRINTLLREQASIKNQLARIKSKHHYTITANNSGKVTGIQVVEGETLSASMAQSKPLLNILPEGYELVAALLLPSRSAGFVTKGQITKLRFDAFPYQRFGFIKSEIEQVDQVLLLPNEVQLPITLHEPVYRIKASLDETQINAFGKSFDLRNGMLFEADIILEERTLVEWLLEPILSLHGKI